MPHPLDSLPVREDLWFLATGPVGDTVLSAVDHRLAAVLGNTELLAQGILIIGLVYADRDNVQWPYAPLDTGRPDAVVKSFVRAFLGELVPTVFTLQ